MLLFYRFYSQSWYCLHLVASYYNLAVERVTALYEKPEHFPSNMAEQS